MTSRPVVGSPEWVARRLTDNMRAALARLDAEGSLEADRDFRRTCEALVMRSLATRSGIVYTITEHGRAVAASDVEPD